MMRRYPVYKDSCLNWLSQIPAHWNELPNIAIFQERIERGFEDNELLSVTMTEGIIRQSELETKKDISNENKSNYKRVCKGDIAYNKMRMWQGAVGYSRYEGIVSPAYVILRPKCKINPKYFHYLFRIPWYTNESYRNSYGIHDDQLSLRYVDFKRMYSPFPPIEEQDEIVAFLEEQTAVANEVLAGGSRYGAAEFQQASYIHTTPLQDPRRADLLTDLDRGEAEAIALALEQNAELLIMDKRLGRRHASRLGLPLTGSLGILLKAKQEGYLTVIKPLLTQIEQGGIYLSPNLIAQALQQAGET